jgi:hypothetical protein
MAENALEEATQQFESRVYFQVEAHLCNANGLQLARRAK